ncbi:MAG: hypothetical protein IMW99_11300 [Firmicutes bacterium]|nr:hypothetical protein [Bacillota bacterium]
MFVVEVGAALTTVLLFRDVWAALSGGAGAGPAGGAAGSQATSLPFDLQITAWLWFTVLFANFAESVAEGRGKAQAETLRRTRTETLAKRIVGTLPDGSPKVEIVPASALRAGDLVWVEAGDIIPSDGEIVEGIASVDESAITGESAPVIREAGGDRSAVTGGTRVLSDQIKVQISSNPGETFLDRMIALVEGARRQKTPNEIALTILLIGLTLIFLLAVATLEPFALYSHPARKGTPLINYTRGTPSLPAPGRVDASEFLPAQLAKRGPDCAPAERLIPRRIQTAVHPRKPEDPEPEGARTPKGLRCGGE